MAKLNEHYQIVTVESYLPDSTSGLHGKVHIRPCAGQGFPSKMHVECARELKNNYPVGTQFRIKAKLTDKEGSGDFLYSHFAWKYEVLE